MRKLAIVASLLATCVPLGSTIASAQQFPSIGMNIPGLSYYNNMAMYARVDYAWSGNWGRWDKLDGSAAANLDATGAPTEPADTAFPANWGGTLTLEWDGDPGAFTSLDLCSGGEITTVGGHNTQSVTCPVVNSRGNGGQQNQTWLQLSVTPPITNISMKMEDGRTCGGIFNCDFINQTAPFVNFRYMDLLNTNFGSDGVSINPVSNWSDRTWPNEGSRSGTIGGVAYEDIIALTNYTGKSAWINIPAQATDDYVCQLARLLAYGEQGDKLNQYCNPTAPGNGTTEPIRSDVTLYIEQTNEPWNWLFPITLQLYCWANGIGPDGTLQSCPTGNVTPPSTYVMQQLSTPPWRNGFQGDQFGKQAALQFLFTYRNKQIFRQVFTAAGLPNQVQIVLNTQSFNGGGNQYYLQNFWMPVYGEMPADVMAFAPYLAPVCQNAGSCPTQDTTVDMIYDDINMTYSDPMNGMAAEMMSDLQIAQSVNMAPVAYEGSVSWQQDDVDLEIAATKDPRMKMWTSTYLQLWTQIMGPNALFNYFSLYSAWSQYGNWGAKANQADACSHRWSALMELIGGTDCGGEQAN